MRNKIALSYAGLSVMTLIIGLSFIFVKIGLRYSNPYDLLAHRFNAAMLSLLILCLFGVVRVKITSLKDFASVAAVSLFYPVSCFGFQAVGMQFSTVTQAGVIFSFLPVFMLIAGKIFLNESTTAWQKVGVILSVAGLIFIFINKSSTNIYYTKGVILMLIAVLSMIGYFIVGKKIIRRYDPISLTAIMIFTGFVIFNALAIFVRFRNQTLHSYFAPLSSANFIIAVLYLGVLSSVVTSFLSNYALIRISTTKISIFGNLNPIIAIISGIVLLNEQLFWYDIVGGVAVICGVVLVLFFTSKYRV